MVSSTARDGYLLKGNSGTYYLSDSESNTPKTIKLPDDVINESDTHIWSMTWDGESIYAIKYYRSQIYAFQLLKTDDLGQNWQRLRLPSSRNMQKSARARSILPTVIALDKGKIMLHASGGNTPILTEDVSSRYNWVDLAGISFWKSRILANDTGVYMTSDVGGLLKLVMTQEPLLLDSFE